jgi:hypothetical protein
MAERSKQAQYKHEYDQRDYVKANERIRLQATSHRRRIQTMKKRLEEFPIEDLIQIAQLKCNEAGLDFEAQKTTIEAVLRILHGQETI